MSDLGARRWGGTWGAAAAVGVGAFVALRAGAQAFLFDDGPHMALAVAADDGSLSYHVALYPLARALRAWSGELGGVDALTRVAALAMAAALGGVVVLARAVGVSLGGALLLAALFAVSPACVFHGTTAEVHGLHAGVATLAVVAVVVANALRPRRGADGVRLVVAAVASAACVFAHQSAVLSAPGLAVLAASGLARRAPTLGDRVRRVALACAVVGAATWLAREYGGVLFGASVTEAHDYAAAGPTVFFGFAHRPFDAASHFHDWVGVWPSVAVLALAGLVARRRSFTERELACVAAIVPTFLATAYLSVPSRGGYALGTMPYVALLAAHGVEAACRLSSARTRASVAGVALVATANLGWSSVHRPDEVRFGRIGAERAHDMGRLLPTGGLLVGYDVSRQFVAARDPRVREWRLAETLPRAEHESGRASDGAPLIDHMRALLPQLDARIASEPGGVVWDGCWRLTTPEGSAAIDAWLVPFEALLRERYAADEQRFDERSYLVLRLRE